MEILKKEMVEYIIIHHSNRTFDCPFFVKLRHKFLRGWSDTGYHFIIGNKVITKDGKVYKARSIDYVGAHSYGYNKKSLGICLIGNFDCCTPTFKQYRSLIRLIILLKIKYGILSENVLGHNETSVCIKTCPGNFVPMERIRRLI